MTDPDIVIHDPSEFKDPNKKINKFSVFYYQHRADLFSGDKFGDKVLDKNGGGGKRTTTIIVSDDTHFGIILSDDYDRIFHILNQNHREKTINKILQFYLLQDIGKYSMKNYYSQFGLVSARLGDKLLNENTNNDNIVLISHGEYSLSTRKSLNDLEELITYYDKKLTIKKEEKQLKFEKNNKEKYDKFTKCKRDIKVSCFI